MKPIFLIRLNGRPFSRSKYLAKHKARLSDLRHVYPINEVSIKTTGNKLTVTFKTL